MLACYVVVAFLTGMRDSEVQSLRRGCLEEVRDAYGQVARLWIRGLASKKRHTPVMRTWVVIEPVARALAALERLTSEVHGTTVSSSSSTTPASTSAL